jgi:cytochrome c5
MRVQHTFGRFFSYLLSGCILILIATQSVELVRAAPAQESSNNQAELVEKGREAYSQACVQCHGASRTVIQQKPEEGWRRTIYAMISRGSPLMADEIEPLTAYLTATYGPSSLTMGTNDNDNVLQDAPGRSVLMRSCSSCHALSLVRGTSKTESEWQQTIDQMITYGAEISAADKTILAGYAAAHFGVQ